MLGKFLGHPGLHHTITYARTSTLDWVLQLFVLARPWMPRIDMHKQPRYAANRECVLWRSCEGANDWRICELLPATVDSEKGAQDLVPCIFNAMEARMSLMVREGEVGAVGTTNNRR